MIPDRRSGHDFQNATRVVAIPIGHGEFGPARFLVFEQIGELWQAAALFGPSEWQEQYRELSEMSRRIAITPEAAE